MDERTNCLNRPCAEDHENPGADIRLIPFRKNSHTEKATPARLVSPACGGEKLLAISDGSQIPPEETTRKKPGANERKRGSHGI